MLFVLRPKILDFFLRYTKDKFQPIRLEWNIQDNYKAFKMATKVSKSSSF